MTDLNKLRVSLTKHGAHKLADLIMAFPANKVLHNTWGKYKGIRIDAAQAQNIMSVDNRGDVPPFWDQAREMGLEAVQELLLLAIIFSHHDLIKAMQSGATGNKKGVIKRGLIIAGKAYTNFACILDELGFAQKHTAEEVSFDLSRIFLNPNLTTLVGDLIKTKLIQAKWDQQNDLISECIALKLEKVLSISPGFFKEWLSGQVSISVIESEIIEEEPEIQEFKFRPGHHKRSTIYISRRKAVPAKEATALHSEIQNKLHTYLSSKYGEESVGSEIDSGIGTWIDLVLKFEDQIFFYEIKTDTSVRICIREALPQLLEYAYWPNRERAKKLIIVSQNKITKQGKTYLEHLRTKFNIPIFYQQINLKMNRLEEIT